MLILNSGKEATRLPKVLIDKLRAEIGERGTKLKYVDRLMFERKYTDGSRKKVGPASVGILMEERVLLNIDPKSENFMEYDPKGEVVVVRYSMHLRFDKNQNPIYEGYIDRPQTISQSDYELYWFLTRCSSLVLNSKNVKNTGNAPYEIEQREVHALKKRQGLQSRKTVEFKLLADEAETGIGHDMVKRIAASYWIENAAEMGENELRDLILQRVEQDERTGQFSGERDNKGWTFFLSLVQDPEQQSVRELINRLCSRQEIAWDETYRRWCYVNDKSKFGNEGYYGGVLLKVPQGNHYQGLLKELKINVVLKATLTDLLKEQGALPATSNANGSEEDESPSKKANALVAEGKFEEALTFLKEVAKDPSQRGWVGRKVKDIEDKMAAATLDPK